MASGGVLQYICDSNFLVWINSQEWDHQVTLQPSL